MRRFVLTCAACLLTSTAAAQTPTQTTRPRAVNHTAYSANTELFAEWVPFVAGQATRLTAHFTHTGDRFTPFTEGKVTLTLTVDGIGASAAADGPERPGVFRLNVTPTKPGTGRIVIEIAAGPERFTIDNVPVYDTVAAALARQTPVESGLISYAKERSWDADFATAPVVISPGDSSIIAPLSAIVRDGETTRVYIQRTPERFELREVKTRRTIGDRVEVISGLRAGERIVVRGADKMPRP